MVYFYWLLSVTATTFNDTKCNIVRIVIFKLKIIPKHLSKFRWPCSLLGLLTNTTTPETVKSLMSGGSKHDLNLLLKFYIIRETYKKSKVISAKCYMSLTSQLSSCLTRM